MSLTRNVGFQVLLRYPSGDVLLKSVVETCWVQPLEAAEGPGLEVFGRMFSIWTGIALNVDQIIKRETSIYIHMYAYI